MATQVWDGTEFVDVPSVQPGEDWAESAPVDLTDYEDAEGISLTSEGVLNLSAATSMLLEAGQGVAIESETDSSVTLGDGASFQIAGADQSGSMTWKAGSGGTDEGLRIYTGPSAEHTLRFDETGVLLVDGDPVGGSVASHTMYDLGLVR